MLTIGKNSAISNVTFNLMGSLIVTGTTQIVLYPLISRALGTERFGTILTLLGIVNMIGVVLGGSLNNVRLLRTQQYQEERVSGDFTFLLISVIVIGAVITVLASTFLKNQATVWEMLSLPIITIFIISRSYLSVFYRIRLNYLYFMLQMMCLAVGYIVALPLFTLTHYWPIIFISGEAVAFIFTIKTTGFLTESAKRTVLYKSTQRDALHLVSSNAMANLSLYLDRLLINPFLGPAAVSLLYVATFVSKMMGVSLQPIPGVLLSYLSVMPKDSGKKMYIVLGFISLCAGLAVLLISVPISGFIIGILYPKALNEAEKYFYVANIGAAVGVMGSLYQPVVLKYCPVLWQVFIQLLYLITYIVLVLFFIKSNGLYGFCTALIMANSVRYVAFITLGYVYIMHPLKKLEGVSQI